jgi:dihydroxy-acid dehydratase
VLKSLLTHGALHGECLTLSGKTLKETLQSHAGPDGTVIRNEPIMKKRRVVVLKGNLAPDGALIKIAGLKSLVFEGRAPRVRLGGGVRRGGDAAAPTRKAKCW